MKSRYSCYRTIVIVALTVSLFAPGASARPQQNEQDILLYDHFSTDDHLDSSVWYFFTHSVNNAIWEVHDSVLCVHSGEYAGSGGTVHSVQEFTPGQTALVLETRSSVSNGDGGGWGFFGDEFDGSVMFSIRQEGAFQAIVRPDSATDPLRIDIEGVDVTAWHTYRIELSTSTAKFYVDESLVATHTDGVPQGKPMHVRLDRVSWGQDEELLVDYVSLEGTTVDTEPPAAVTDLSASRGSFAGTVDLTWTAPGDDGDSGTAAGYLVRYNASPITEANWASSTDVIGEPDPNPAGTTERMTVDDLTPAETYYFAVKTEDEVPNTSAVSNSPAAAAGSGSHPPRVVYLPALMNTRIYYPPVNVANHTTGADGLVTVPLAGGGGATFRFVDRLQQPVSNVPVVSIENEAGVTLLAAAQRQGFFPKLLSAPASSSSQDGAVLTQAAETQTDVPLVPLNDESKHAEEQDLIYGHILSLPDNMDEWERQNRNTREACEAVGLGVDAFLLGVTYVTAPAHLGAGFVAHAAVHVAVIEGLGVPACKEMFGGNPVQKHASIENETMGAYLLDWDATIENTTGVVFGQVADADTHDGLQDAEVTVDGSPLLSAVSFPNGWYRIEGVNPGFHSVAATRTGYESDSVSEVSVSANRATQVDRLDLEPINPGVWRIQNDTGGELTVELEGVGTEVLSADTLQYDWSLPAGTYNFKAWTVACGGVADSSVTIYEGLITTTRFYCGPTALQSSSATKGADTGRW